MKSFLKIAWLALALFAANWLAAQTNPKFVANMGGYYSGKIVRGAFLAQQGVSGFYKVNAQHWEPLRVYAFNMAVFRDSVMIFQTHNDGQLVSDKIRGMLTKLQRGDEVLIYSIYAWNNSAKEVFLSPLQYFIQ